MGFFGGVIFYLINYFNIILIQLGLSYCVAFCVFVCVFFDSLALLNIMDFCFLLCCPFSFARSHFPPYLLLTTDSRIYF